MNVTFPLISLASFIVSSPTVDGCFPLEDISKDGYIRETKFFFLDFSVSEPF